MNLSALSTSLPVPGLIFNLPLSSTLHIYYFHFSQSKEETPAPLPSVSVMILLPVVSSVIVSLHSLHPSGRDNLLQRCCFCLCRLISSVIDFSSKLIDPEISLPVIAKTPAPSSACYLLWLSPRIHSFSDHILFPELLISCLRYFGSLGSDLSKGEGINKRRGIKG